MGCWWRRLGEELSRGDRPTGGGKGPCRGRKGPAGNPADGAGRSDLNGGGKPQIQGKIRRKGKSCWEGENWGRRWEKDLRLHCNAAARKAIGLRDVSEKKGTMSDSGRTVAYESKRHRRSGGNLPIRDKMQVGWASRKGRQRGKKKDFEELVHFQPVRCSGKPFRLGKWNAVRKVQIISDEGEERSN